MAINRSAAINHVLDSHKVDYGESYIDKRKVGVRYKFIVYGGEVSDKVLRALEQIEGVMYAKNHISKSLFGGSYRSVAVFFNSHNR